MFDKEAMKRALDWLEAHPDQHTTGSLAKVENDVLGQDVSTLDPRATCWCALGRYAVEMNIDTSNMRRLGIPERLLDDIWEANDDNYYRGGPKASIREVRKVIEA